MEDGDELIRNQQAQYESPRAPKKPVTTTAPSQPSEPSPPQPPTAAIKPFAISLRKDKPGLKSVQPQRALHEKDPTEANASAAAPPVPLQTNTFNRNRPQAISDQSEQSLTSDIATQSAVPTEDDYIIAPLEGYGARLLSMMGGGTGGSKPPGTNAKSRKPEPWGGFRGIGAEKLDVKTEYEIGAWGVGAGARPSGRRARPPDGVVRDRRGKQRNGWAEAEGRARRSPPRLGGGGASDGRRTREEGEQRDDGRRKSDHRRSDHERMAGRERWSRRELGRDAGRRARSRSSSPRRRRD